MFEAAHQKAWQPSPGISGGEVRGVFEELTQHEAGFQSSKRGSDAEVDALAESDVSLDHWAVESELTSVVEVQRVAVGCTP
jgi:hypothetical protein